MKSRAALTGQLVCDEVGCGQAIPVTVSLAPYIDETRVGVNLQVDASAYDAHVREKHPALLPDPRSGA